MVHSIEELRQVRIDGNPIPISDMVPQTIDRAMSTASRTKAEARNRETRIEYRHQYLVNGLWISRSNTVGIPSGRLPPVGLGISTRLTGKG